MHDEFFDQVVVVPSAIHGIIRISQSMARSGECSRFPIDESVKPGVVL